MPAKRPPDNNDDIQEENYIRSNVTLVRYQNQLYRMLDLEPADTEAVRVKTEEIRELIKNGVERLKKRKNFNKRVKETLWKSVVPIGGVILGWVHPEVGKTILNFIKSVVAP